MVATFTRAVEVRRWLMDAAADLPGFADVLVTYAWDNRRDPRTRLFTNSSRHTQEPASLKSGRTHRNERGSFDVVLLHHGVDEPPLVTAERAVELMGLVEGLVADNRHPSLDGVNWVVAQGEGSVTDLFADTGYLVEVVLRVTYDARLQ